MGFKYISSFTSAAVPSLSYPRTRCPGRVVNARSYFRVRPFVRLCVRTTDPWSPILTTVHTRRAFCRRKQSWVRWDDSERSDAQIPTYIDARNDQNCLRGDDSSSSLKAVSAVNWRPYEKPTTTILWQKKWWENAKQLVCVTVREAGISIGSRSLEY